jgi:hypothetical protein
MITYNDIYKAKKNPLVLFESPLNAEWQYYFAPRQYCIASGGLVIK